MVVTILAMCLAWLLIRTMKTHKRSFIFLLLLLSLISFAPITALAVETGAAAPGFTLKNLQGQEVSLADFKGRLVMLKLATTWCHSCKELSAEIEKIGPFLKDHNVVFLEVYLQDSEEMVETYLNGKDHPMTFEALLDDGQVYEAYSVYAIPRLLIVDADQVVRFDSGGTGSVPAEEIVALINKVSLQTPAAGST
jgi:thiol-disulfide isomerase/thioredoxin